MVRFGKDRYIIEVCDDFPVESWMELYKEMIYLVGLVDNNNFPSDGLFCLTQMMGEMMPEWEVARKMTK